MINPNDPGLKSWVVVAAHSDFPIQNLPFGIFKPHQQTPRAGVAIGEYVVDLHYLEAHGYFKDLNLPSGVFDRSRLNDFFTLGKKSIRAVREQVSVLLRHGNTTLQEEAIRNHVLYALRDVEMLLPVSVPNYTDFYSSEEHATNVGSMFRDPKNALLPNWKYLPVGYHGRASSIVVSGTPVRRPRGQVKTDSEFPSFMSTHKLDFEVEMAFITCGETKLGHPIHTHEAEEHIAGFALFNDWSARDIQQWEYVPLGPFLGKNFASTLSPWIVTLDALEPFRVDGPEQNPHVLPYLAFEGKKNFDIVIETLLQPEQAEAVVVSRTNAKYLYWNVNQQLAHHTVNGCNIEVGDVYASGTISGPSPGSFGSLLELSWNGQKKLHMTDDTTRTFLLDGDTVTLHAYASHNGVRIGFGACSGKILPSL